jgi:type VI secretion system protein VasD
MNPGPDGTDRPLTLTVVQMRGTGAFDASDFFALRDPQVALGGEFVKAEQIVLSPGSSASRTIGIEDGVTAIGIVAGFRDPTGKIFRVKTPAPSGPSGAILAVSSGGISLTST